QPTVQQAEQRPTHTASASAARPRSQAAAPRGNLPRGAALWTYRQNDLNRGRSHSPVATISCVAVVRSIRRHTHFGPASARGRRAEVNHLATAVRRSDQLAGYLDGITVAGTRRDNRQNAILNARLTRC